MSDDKWVASNQTLLLTDVVDSTRLSSEVGDGPMAVVWADHDRVSRVLLRVWDGREIARSDGFLLLFKKPDRALGFAAGYHRLLKGLSLPLTARVGIHVGPVELRRNGNTDVQRGAPRYEVDGIALPVAARLLAAANAEQTLMSAQALQALGSLVAGNQLVIAPPPGDVDDARALHVQLRTHGHWQFKGLETPMEVFEAGTGECSFTPPLDSDKAYRVARRGNDWAPIREVAHKIPAERDRFIGRTASLSLLSSLIYKGARAVTVVGLGGVGKTRLTVHYARRWLGEYAGGAWFCDLSTAQTVDGVAHAVAQGLGLSLDKADPVELIGDAVAGRGRCLVLLDNFEQVSKFAEETLGSWLQRAPDATFIVTSRERLGIVGEHALVLEPMVHSDAEALLRERIKGVGTTLPLTASDQAAIGPLVELLDCLPLAVELAAARAVVMQPADLLARMGDRFELLKARGGRHKRQMTLRATLDWSWDLLSDMEQDALAQCSIFEGGFTLVAAEAVLALRGPDDPIATLNSLQGLVEKSLMRRVGVQRFDLLRSVGEYASERLVESGGETSAAARHWCYFGSLDEYQAIAERCVEAENLVAGCRRATKAGDIKGAAATLINAWAALNLTGPFKVAIEMAESLYGVSFPHARGAAMTARWVAGSARFLAGEVATARQDLEEAASWAGAESALRARVLISLGQLERSVGNKARAETLLEDGLGSARDARDPGLICRAYNALGVLRLAQGRLEDARKLLNVGLEIARSTDDLKQQAALLGNIGVVEHQRGREGRTVEHYEAAFRLARQIGDVRFEGNMRSNLGLIFQEAGLLDDALEQLHAAFEIARVGGHIRLAAHVSCNLGLVQESLGDRDAALARYSESVELANRLGDAQLVAHLKIYRGRQLIRLGRREEGAACLERLPNDLSDCEDQTVLGLLSCAKAELAAANHDFAALEANASQALQRMRASQAGVGSELEKEVQTILKLVSYR